MARHRRPGVTSRWLLAVSLLILICAWVAMVTGVLHPLWAVAVTALVVQIEVLRDELAGSRAYIAELVSKAGTSTGRAAGGGDAT